MRSRTMVRRCFLLIALLSAVALCGSGSASLAKKHKKTKASSFPVFLEPVATTLSTPVYVTNARDGRNRLFFVEQGGAIKVLQPGSSSPTTFLNLASKVVFDGEQGLLGLAFHPQFRTNRRFFVDYTRAGDGATVIAEYHASALDPNVADSAEMILLTIDQPFANHNGGMIEFGPDGFLYIAMGDGGSGDDPGNRAQNINELLGKILRIDVDHPNGPSLYSSPADNPFFGPTPGRDEIFAFGLRNPWRFSFDRSTGQLYIGDVGQGTREEVDIGALGGNFGWRIMEGSICNPHLNGGVCTPPTGHIPPIAEYTHAGGRCSIIGGYVYRGVMSTLPVGAYVYGDLCTGEIFLLQSGTQNTLLDTNLIISSFGEDEAGELYVCELANTVFRINIQAGPGGMDTAGLFNMNASSFFLRNSNGSGIADLTFSFGPQGAGWSAIAGDWNGNGVDTITLFNPNTKQFFLKNTDTAGGSDATFTFDPGGSGFVPLAGDWNGDGFDTVGLYSPATGMFFLKNSNTSGGPDIAFRYGPAGLGWIPIVGDWNGDGVDTIGLYDPAHSAFFLRNSNNAGVADVTFSYGPSGLGWIPLSGDWNGDRTGTVGLYDPVHGAFFLKNTNATGTADIAYTYGPSSSTLVPLTGDWDGS
jgi:glucose/arabinose dehydrogenase